MRKSNKKQFANNEKKKRSKNIFSSLKDELSYLINNLSGSRKDAESEITIVVRHIHLSQLALQDDFFSALWC